jgi:hypothetical protein
MAEQRSPKGDFRVQILTRDFNGPDNIGMSRHLLVLDAWSETGPPILVHACIYGVG